MSAAGALLAALRAKAGVDFAARADTTPWCSVDRSGERHLFELTFPDAAPAAALLARLGDHPFELPGAFVAEIRGRARPSAGRHVRVDVEALTFAAD